MNAVVSAIEAGRCSVAVSGALLRDSEVMLALTERAALSPMALSGPVTSPLVDVGDKGVARALGAPNGVLVIVEPEAQDQAGVGDIVKLLGRSGHKPKVVVVARNFNPFAFPALVPFKPEHHKDRGKSFLKGLPLPPVDQAAPEMQASKSAPKTGADAAPKFVFVGREDELVALGGMLGTGGPIVLSGPHGVGKRLLVDQAIATSGLTRLPDLQLGRGTGFDTLIGRLAAVCEAAGSKKLAEVAARPDALPGEIVEAAVQSLAEADCAGQVMVVAGLHTALGRQRDFFRKSRLEMLLVALLTHAYSLRLVFLSVEPPLLYREGAAANLRVLELGGLKGRFLHEIFEAYKAPEFPRDRFGPISEKIHGHPMAARAYAIEVRERPEGVALTEDPKFMKMETLATIEPLRKRLEKRAERLGEEDRAALAVLAHLHVPVTQQVLNDLGVKRKPRLQLLAQGLLDMVGTETERLYRVHPLVRSFLSWRETSDFETLKQVGEVWRLLGKDATGVQKVACDQEYNRSMIGSRQLRSRAVTAQPDQDHLVESCIGMIRSQKPNFQLARQRLGEILNVTPNNADAHLLRLELIAAEDRANREMQRGRERGERGDDEVESADAKEFNTFAEEAMAQAPVPEIFHRIAGHYLHRRARHKAIEVLERGVVALPTEARLLCRLGSLLLRHGRRKEAVQRLQEAMLLEPMLPDTYGLLGMAKRDEGASALPEAETLLREAVRLAPADPVQTARLADLLIHLASIEADPTARAARFAEAKELLETSLRGDEKAPEAQLLLAQLHRESGGDLERAAWFLKQSKKNSERGSERHHRIALERALVHAAVGELDDAELLARDQAARNPSSHRAFATLAAVLEARQQLIPAHAEYLRAKERAPQGSLWAQAYDAELARLQSVIEAVAAGLMEMPAPPAPSAPIDHGAPARGEATGNTAHRTIRRRRKDEDDDEPSAAAPSVDADDEGSEPDHGAPPQEEVVIE